MDIQNKQTRNCKLCTNPACDGVCEKHLADLMYVMRVGLENMGVLPKDTGDWKEAKQDAKPVHERIAV